MFGARHEGRVDMIGGLADRVLMRVPFGVAECVDDRRAQPFRQRKPMILTEYPPRRQRRRAGHRRTTARDWQLGQRRENP